MREIKICEQCNFINEIDALECSNCEGDLTYVIPSSINDELEERGTMVFNALKLFNETDKKVIEIPMEGGIIGREGTIELGYFASNLYISSKHARIYYRGMELILVDERSTNGTKINGVTIPKGVETKVLKGDRIVFANMQFLVIE